MSTCLLFLRPALRVACLRLRADKQACVHALHKPCPAAQHLCSAGAPAWGRPACPAPQACFEALNPSCCAPCSAGAHAGLCRAGQAGARLGAAPRPQRPQAGVGRHAPRVASARPRKPSLLSVWHPPSLLSSLPNSAPSVPPPSTHPPTHPRLALPPCSTVSWSYSSPLIHTCCVVPPRTWRCPPPMCAGGAATRRALCAPSWPRTATATTRTTTARCRRASRRGRVSRRR